MVFVAGCIMKCGRRYGGLNTILTMMSHFKAPVSGHKSHGKQYIRVPKPAR
jgi:hypothetical protein